MHLKPLLKEWDYDNNFNQVLELLKSTTPSKYLIAGLEGSQRNYFFSSLYEHTNKQFLIITADSYRAEKIYEDLLSFLPKEDLLLFPGRDFNIGEDMIARSSEIREKRLAVLEIMAKKERLIVVMPVISLLFRMLPFAVWEEMRISLKTGYTIEREILIEKLVNLGYKRVPIIEGRGQFSVRGDIVDVFSPGSEEPLRIEFFDNILESLRNFDFISQRSGKSLGEFIIFPAEEFFLNENILKTGKKKIEDELHRVGERLKKSGSKGTEEKLNQKIQKHLDKMDFDNLSEFFYGYFTFFYGAGDSLLDYLKKEPLLLIDDPVKTFAAAEDHYKHANELQGDLLVQGEALPVNISLLWSLEEILSRFRKKILYFSLFNSATLKISPKKIFIFDAKKVTNYHGQMNLLREEFRQWKKDGYRIFFLTSSLNQSEWLIKYLSDNKIPVEKFPADAERLPGNLPAAVVTGNLSEGFLLPALKIVFVTEENLFPKKKKKRKLAGDADGLRLRDYNELSLGDYVVHDNHGIGKYLGIRTLEIDNAKKDYLHISYAGEDKLFIPIEQIDLIQKYIGFEGKKPRLQRLGGSEWNRLKKRAKASAQELAKELISLYSARESIKKDPARPDSPWEAEFASYFPYEETAHQLKSIKEVTKDLTGNKPMDRLLCGDVGYGKTEVAMRAAFKAVMSGKQVAILSPTTILAQQHYRNFSERFAPFPVKVALLSRFVSNSNQKETLKQIKLGTTDIVIGTHRLLSRDINFKELGLIIIDEEHRFGVRHKERLKKLRLDADVLALTATPIPRTLHMSLSGVRDLSIIETPPENRYPVQTYVTEYSPYVVKEAISREIERGGQVYYVFNRVQQIEKKAEELRKLMPQARIAVAHGQMDEGILEKIMNDFIEGDYDVLLTTTIIEAGLDIPNVNTLIVFDADRFGLAQLYQLRGRVGRSSRLAYAYLTFQRGKVLTEAAEKRLQSIKEFAELGSGFKVALRDLEIRGAGNILGPEQHGFMVNVGFELYCRLLEEAVNDYKGEKPKTETDPRIDLKISAFLPGSYIPDQEQKIEFYQRIYAADSVEEILDIGNELIDRFGNVPFEVDNLLMITRLRLLAKILGIDNITGKKDKLFIGFLDKNGNYIEKFLNIMNKYQGKIFSRNGKNEVILNIAKRSLAKEVIPEVEKAFIMLKEDNN